MGIFSAATLVQIVGPGRRRKKTSELAPTQEIKFVSENWYLHTCSSKHHQNQRYQHQNLHLEKCSGAWLLSEEGRGALTSERWFSVKDWISKVFIANAPFRI